MVLYLLIKVKMEQHSDFHSVGNSMKEKKSTCKENITLALVSLDSFFLVFDFAFITELVKCVH